jgi:NADH:ubiquinone oxidoreductase subunit 6 (subunit J)
MFFLDSIWLIPLFPLFGAAVMLLLVAMIGAIVLAKREL